MKKAKMTKMCWKNYIKPSWDSTAWNWSDNLAYLILDILLFTMGNTPKNSKNNSALQQELRTFRISQEEAPE